MRRFALIAMGLCFLGPPAPAGGGDAGVHRLTLWGLPDTKEFRGTMAAIDAWARRNRIEVVMGTPGGQGQFDPQKLMTAIAAGTPPDLIWLDRFQVSGWAARDAFLCLDAFFQASQILRREDIYDACWEESCYRKPGERETHLYAMPWNTDVRGLYCNMDLLAEKGLTRPPRDWDEIQAYCRKLLDRRGGVFRVLGFAPCFGNSWLYLYGWLNGGRFLSEDGTRCLLDSPPVVEALSWMADTYAIAGGGEPGDWDAAKDVRSFEGAAQLDSIAHPFFYRTGDREIDPDRRCIAMVIDGNWLLNFISRYRPELDFTVVPPPPPKGKEPVTWSGGFSWVIPKGLPPARARAAWRLIEHLCSPEGWIEMGRAQRDYQQRDFLENRDNYAPSLERPEYIPWISASREANRALARAFPIQNERIRKAQEVFISMVEYTRFRPVTPVGQKLWDEQASAMNNGVIGIGTPEALLREGARRVQEELDRVFAPPPGRVVSNRSLVAVIVAAIGLIVLAGALAVLLRGGLRTGQARATAAGYLFASPWILGFVVLLLGPMLYSLALSFCRYDGLHAVRFVGLENFRVMARDPLFYKSLGNTAIITVLGVPLGLVLGLGIALLLSLEIRGMALFRTCFYLPAIIPVVATAVLWIWLFNPQVGLVNPALEALGILPFLRQVFGLSAGWQPNWPNDPWACRIMVVIMLLWTAGASMVIWLAGLKGIPRPYYEAVAIDGGGRIARFFHVTLPLITPYIFFNLVMGIIGYLQIFTQAYVLASPPDIGPDNVLLFYVYYIFQNAFTYFRLGYACALAWVLFVVILLLTWIQFRLAPRWVHYGA